MSFPKNFLWGAATSAGQYEGAALEDGKGWTTMDERGRLLAGKIPDASITADGYHHIDEDIDLIQKLGLKSYRFFISWARILPDGDGKINPKGVAFYRHIVERLHQIHVEPVITLLHFDIPFALVKKYGGFTDRRCIDAYEKYCRICFKEFGDLVHYWITINEQNVMAMIPNMLKDPEIKSLSWQITICI